MSKASEYAKHLAGLKKPADCPVKDRNGDTVVTAMVRDDGELVLVGRYAPCITPAEALDLARWIADTFGDREAVDAHAAIDAALSARASAAIATALDSPDVNTAHEHAAKLATAAHDALDEAVKEARQHVCTLPDSISEALNSGDGTYRP